VDIQIREQRLPGIGRRYDLALNRRRTLIVVVNDRSGSRELSVVSGDAEEPDVTVTLTQDQAVTLAALLTGARFSIDATGDSRVDADEDDTPELVEQEQGRRCQPGDRVVIAVRRERLSSVVDQLVG
jgi:K+/H+ antiporter YhaU regulatory subunit KhtT